MIANVRGGERTKDPDSFIVYLEQPEKNDEEDSSTKYRVDFTDALRRVVCFVTFLNQCITATCACYFSAPKGEKINQGKEIFSPILCEPKKINTRALLVRADRLYGLWPLSPDGQQAEHD